MTINNLIVEIDSTYNNEVGGITVNSTIESVAHINRVATVVEAPDFVTVKKGDKIVAHHNIFREKNGIRGKRLMSNYHLEGNKYFVPLLEVFAYKRGDEEWKALSPFTFVRPIEKEDEVVGGIIINATEHNSYKNRVKNRGIMVYPNDDLIKQGVNKGDEVIFTPYSEYEFNINNEILYKMSTKDIVAKV